MSRRVALRIDELVLDGVAADPRLEEDVRAELAELLAERPPRAAQSAPVRRTALDRGRLAPAIARAVHRGLQP